MNFLRICDQTWEKAAKTFDRTKKSLDEDVAALQIWLKTQPHLPDYLDVQCLRNFLLLNKFSVELAKQKIDNYYTIRTNLKEVYDDSNPKLPYNEEFCKAAYLVLHTELTDDLCRIVYFKIKNFDLMNTYEPMNFFKKMVVIQDLRLREDVMVGDIIIADCKGLTVPVILKITPTMLYRAVLIYEKIFSMRLKGLYLLNMHPLGEQVLGIVRKIMKPKVFSRIQVLADTEALKDVVPSKMLPKEFGGEGPSLDILEEVLNEMFKYHQNLFDNLDGMKVDERYRPPKLESDDFTSVYGNFKKLEID